jgi:hypothetical protein
MDYWNINAAVSDINIDSSVATLEVDVIATVIATEVNAEVNAKLMERKASEAATVEASEGGLLIAPSRAYLAKPTS